LIRNGVARQAETVEDIPLVTLNGPIRFGAPVSRTTLWARKKALVDGPPEPTMMPVRSFEMSASARPLSASASFMAM
jgi:hypothetical protein